VKINLENGKHFTITAKRKKINSIYVQGASLNGRRYSKSYINHSDLLRGGAFDFILGDVTNKTWGAKNKDLPHSRIIDSAMVAVPFVNATSNKFRGSTFVSLSTITSGAKIYYNLFNDTSQSMVSTYVEPIVINNNLSVAAYAEKNNKKTAFVTQRFYRIPEDRTIKVFSKVHQMYTAGGPEALIDGIMGSTNWRAGEWQSYFGTDLDAVVDLQQVTTISELGVHVLQDVSPWIMYPKEVIFYSSNDGNNYVEVARIENASQPHLGEAETQILSKQVSFKARYIKVKVVNGGNLPSWHESAGNPSHLFIDEIIIK
jgi:hypothetical protein